MLAKEIVDEVKGMIRGKDLQGVKKVTIEIGSIAMAHDGHPEHVEDISEENLRFGIDSLVRGTELEKTVFDIKKISGDNWKITGIEVE